MKNKATPKTPRQIVYERALPFAEKNYKKISVIMGRYDGSQKCQHVARHTLEEGADTVAITLSFVPKSGVNVHFINRIGKKYIDHTLGYLSKRNTYYLMSEHSLKELRDTLMSKMLENTKEEVLSKLFTKKERKDFDIDHSHI
ncbi:MAG: hypothetical protein UX77_C0026G0004 [Parcubacteria group bacterium GW2011_GWA1_47_11]|nr:MAG: hypothetical protein UX77_C0026G0004 [Parcubacteria group bacterium GW2011_GWA1_47_11]